ncbi:hypothetical protein CC1G_03886 [Coprinopsis cinerea okayama7|uniref:Uncharacterized protein n=1 Tax=Coprinopsis cinerea (strain Okayama-7 / 130 / ATCC MYA-4618 / FGSC 9003) TaxID=240176 RepID=A8NH34_COPC7|nr:hypothetical protein CC1G_03886 [Coprinopsis cinerea okayama7\|eukprot:XP_001833669.2 hypothetical protein CC1G_03886 [Coprinopsis cinerea okayama7\
MSMQSFPRFFLRTGPTRGYGRVLAARAFSDQTKTPFNTRLPTSPDVGEGSTASRGGSSSSSFDPANPPSPTGPKASSQETQYAGFSTDHAKTIPKMEEEGYDLSLEQSSQFPTESVQAGGKNNSASNPEFDSAALTGSGAVFGKSEKHRGTFHNDTFSSGTEGRPAYSVGGNPNMAFAANQDLGDSSGRAEFARAGGTAGSFDGFSGRSGGGSASSSGTGSGSGNNPPPPIDEGYYGESEAASNKSPSAALGPWLTAVLIAGLGITAFGVGELWGTLTIWPSELRGDLRHGLRELLKSGSSSLSPSSKRSARDLSIQYLQRAWHHALQLPLSKFGKEPYLKTTGIAIALAGVYEEDGSLSKAYGVYKEALGSLQTVGVQSSSSASDSYTSVDSSTSKESSTTPDATAPLLPNLTPKERMRAVAISYKLAELAEKMHLSKDEEEKWLVYSVETILKDVMGKGNVVEELAVSDGKSETRVMMEELNLPGWVMKHDLAAPFEALGTFYAGQGKVHYAMPLYLQAIAILIPPPPQESSTDDQCRAAQLMGNISELIIRGSAPSHSLRSPSSQPSPPSAFPSSPSMEPPPSSSSRSSFTPSTLGINAGAIKTVPSETLMQAESWAKKGLEVAERARKASFVKHPTCEVAYALGLFNLAVLREMSGDESTARQLFHESLDQSKKIGLVEGVRNAEDAITEMSLGSGAKGDLKV